MVEVASTTYADIIEEYTTSATGNDSETKKKYGENDEYMSHLVSYNWFRRT